MVDHRIDTNLDSYDLIVFMHEACFNSAGKLYPNSRKGVYHSGRVILWTHVLATRKSEEFASRFPLPDTDHDSDPGNLPSIRLPPIRKQRTPSRSERISDVLLHLSWANSTMIKYNHILNCTSNTHETETAILLNVIINRFLVWCISLCSSVEEEILKVKNKSYSISYFFFPPRAAATYYLLRRVHRFQVI